MTKKPTPKKETEERMPQKPAQRATGEKIQKGEGEDIIQLILRDHQPLKKLIETLKDGALERADKEGELEKFVPLLVSHAKAEERSLYVQMKEMKALRTEGYEGDTEHAIAEQLVHEINATPDDDEWNAKVKVLAELVEHHIEEEEEEMLPDIEKKINASTRRLVGDQYTQIKANLEMLYRPRPMRAGRVAEQRLH